jgi:hypothetical protein
MSINSGRLLKSELYKFLASSYLLDLLYWLRLVGMAKLLVISRSLTLFLPAIERRSLSRPKNFIDLLKLNSC